MLQSFKRALGASLLAPLALSSFVGCSDDGDIGPNQVGTTAEEIIGGFPARDERFNAVGALGFRFYVDPDLDPDDPLANYRDRSYIRPSDVARAGETHFPFCTATLIAPNAVLTAEHCVDGLWGDEAVPISGAGRL